MTQAFATIYGIEVSEIKDEEYADTFKDWQKLRNSMSTSVRTMEKSNQISKEDADLFKIIVARANLEELEELKTKVSKIRAGHAKVESLRASVVKYDELDAIHPRGKGSVSCIDKQLKDEVIKTKRLIADHKKKEVIDEEEASLRLKHLMGLKTAEEIFDYRESLKLPRVTRPKKQSPVKSVEK
jgi:hypothetical protein